MKIEKDQIPINLNRGASNTRAFPAQPAAAGQWSQGVSAPYGEGTSDSNWPAINNSQIINLRRNMVAEGIRLSDTSMEKIGDYIDHMKEQLLNITKSYPPYPPGSEERTRVLKSFNAIRQQIDELTIPPKNKVAGKIMAGTSTPGEKDFGNIAGSGSVAGTLHSQEVHTGALGLDIPELSQTASDSELETAVKNLGKAMTTLGQRRSALAEDAAAISSSMDYNIEIANFHRSYKERLESFTVSETQVKSRSLELRQALTIKPPGGLTYSQTLFLQLLD